MACVYFVQPTTSFKVKVMQQLSSAYPEHFRWRTERLYSYITLKKCIAKARNFCSFVLESAALLTMCYYAYQFRDEWRSLIGGTLLFLFIVMVRIAWCYLVQCSLLMRCITATEEAFLVADFLFVPLLFIAEIVLIYQDDDLCGMKTKTRWKCHFYLGIVMAPIFLAVCLSRLCRKPDPTPSAQASMSGEQGQRKGHIVGTPDNDGTAEDNAEVNVGPTRRNNDSSMDNAQRRESEEEEDEEEENGAETEDLGLYYGCRDIMDDKDSIFDTENVQGDESDESMEGIPLQAQRCIE
ncbi:uncharacterized protein [Aquarana catesbeiana]|uniref:uncharacterized protein n=1 Tax=Aquarana catesbeiana TaxID=8400 RepID=UPI003CC95D57